MSTACLFCRIVAGEAAAHVVVEDDCCVAFLDVRPLFPGHVLVVPRDHHETLVDLPPVLLGPLFARVRLLAEVMEVGLGAAGSFVAVNNRVSQSVAHMHVHVVPRNPRDGLRGFFWPRQGYRSDAHAAEVAATVRSSLALLANS